MKRVLYLDLVGGASGDMLMGALVDAGAKRELIQRAIDSVIGGVKIGDLSVRPAGLRARKLTVDVAPKTEAHPHRPYRVVRDLIDRAPLAPRVKTKALAAFKILALAEGHVHGVDFEEVEFHEVGSDDAIADVVGVLEAVASLDVEEIACSAIPLGRGLTHGAHGPIPLPGPATLEILRTAPVVGVPLDGETVTPTGAALLRVLVNRFGPAPRMTLDRIGVGAGTRSWPDRPNVVRALLGTAIEAKTTESDEDCVIEANIDDMSPEHLAALSAQLFRAGAIDVWSAPIAMKKQRTGFLISALARRELIEPLAAAFFAHSTTLGVRFYPVGRLRAERHMEEVETKYGKVRVKVSARGDGPPLVAPEWDDCEKLAGEAGVPVRAVSEAALFAAWSKGAPGGK